MLITAAGVLTTPLLSMLGSVGVITMIPGPMFAVYMPKSVGTCCFFPITAVTQNMDLRHQRDAAQSATIAGISVVSVLIPLVVAQVSVIESFIYLFIYFFLMKKI